MNRIGIYIMIVSALSTLFLFPASSGLTTSSIVHSQGIIAAKQYIRSAYVAQTTIMEGKINSHPNAEENFKYLGFNTITLSPGVQGGDLLGINMETHATNDEWADNLEALLVKVDAMGMKLGFWTLGDRYGSGVGIRDPCRGNQKHNMPIMPIAEALSYIDKLGGNNKLGHNFIADPRMSHWTVAVEGYMGETDSNDNIIENEWVSWTQQVCDRIRYHGGKVAVGCSVVNSLPSAGNGGGNGFDIRFKYQVPLWDGHADYIQLHPYGLSRLKGMFDLGIVDGKQEYDWEGFKNWVRSYWFDDVINSIQGSSFSIDDVLIGEFGLWRGQGGDQTTAYFSDENRRDYYNSMFQLFREYGFKNIQFFSFTNGIDVNNPTEYRHPTMLYGVINPFTEQPYPYVADIIRQNYLTM